MDLRGSGASYGRKKGGMMADAARDGSDLIDWIVAQPWSNGRVASTGVSAHGICSMWLTTARNPALKAIVPRFTAFDVFAGSHPGGTLPTRFLRDIAELMRAMDTNQLQRMPENAFGRFLMWAMVKGIKPVDDDVGRAFLAEAVRDHEGNQFIAGNLATAEYRDDSFETPEGRATADDASPFTRAAEIEASGVPIYAYAGWHDGNFARELIALHNTVRTPGSRLIIGPWGHGGKFYSSPLVEKRRRTDFPHAAEIVRFCDPYVRSAKPLEEARIHYFTMGEERWKSCDTWPPAAVTTTYHLDADHRLTTAEARPGADTYDVDFTAGTGVHSRFGKHLTTELFPAAYPDRVARDRKLFCYDSPPLDREVEVTGHPIVTLYVTSTATDGLFIVYLEDLEPGGTVRMVTDGWIRASCRRLAEVKPPHWVAWPYRSFKRSEVMPLVPGEMTELTFDLFPISWLYRRGHAIRVAIAGADQDNLARLPPEGPTRIEIHRGGPRASRVDLPLVQR